MQAAVQPLGHGLEFLELPGGGGGRGQGEEGGEEEGGVFEEGGGFGVDEGGCGGYEGWGGKLLGLVVVVLLVAVVLVVVVGEGGRRFEGYGCREVGAEEGKGLVKDKKRGKVGESVQEHHSCQIAVHSEGE